MKVAVVGAGPSGLVTLKYLITAHKALGIERIEAKLFESEAGVGGTFLARTYEDAEARPSSRHHQFEVLQLITVQLVSSKQLTTFSDFRPSDNDPDFLSAPRYVTYLNEYCTEFGLWAHIHLSTTVISVARGEKEGHIISYQHKSTSAKFKWRCDAVAVCSGLHLTPNIPSIAGIQHVPEVFHSSAFKSRSQFGTDKTILVIGSGETGADVAHLAVTSPTKQVILSHRNGFHLAPKRNLNPVWLPVLGGKPNGQETIPLDNSRASLFDTAYVHPLFRKHDSLLWSFYNAYVRAVLWLTTGTVAGYDQWIGGVATERDHVSKVFFNKSAKVGPYLSAPYRDDKSIIQRIRSSLVQAPLFDTKGRQIDLAPLPEFIDENGVVRFKDNGRPEYQRMKDETIKPEMIVLCTGYQQVFPFLTTPPDLDTQGRKPYPTAADADIRQIWSRHDPTVAFIGFVRPSLGAIPPLAEQQAQLWILRIAAPILIPKPLLPADESHYRLKAPANARVQYGVDHESYVYQLALDMDSALGFQEVIALGYRHDWRIPVVWALSANLNAKFRVRGPWRWNGAEAVMVGEMWQTMCRRRLVLDHFLLSILPILLFGPIMFVAFLFSTVARSVAAWTRRSRKLSRVFAQGRLSSEKSRTPS